MKKYTIIMLCLILFSSFLFGCKTEEENLKEAPKEQIEIDNMVKKGDVLQAKEKAKEYYTDDELDLIISNINITAEIYERKYETYQRNDISQNNSTTVEDDLIIQDGWKSTIKDGYIYINGSVTNKSDKIITYYVITAKYLDENDNVVHSNYTNSIEKLYPDESREFEIMNSYNNYKFAKLIVEEVNFE